MQHGSDPHIDEGKWMFKDDTDEWKEYPSDTNAIIEKAFKRKQKTVKVSLSASVYYFFFKVGERRRVYFQDGVERHGKRKHSIKREEGLAVITFVY